MKLLTILAIVFLAQPPRWKYIVYTETQIEHAGALMYDHGKPVNRFKTDSVWTKFPDSRSAHKYFNDNISKRDGLIYFHGAHVKKAWIDSIAVKP